MSSQLDAVRCRLEAASAQLVPGEVAPLRHRHIRPEPLQHDDVLDGRRLGDRLVRHRLHQRLTAPPQTAVRRDHDLAFASWSREATADGANPEKIGM